MRTLPFAVTLILAGCASHMPTSGRNEVTAPFSVGGEAARRGVEVQIAAWNRGDIEAALSSYWDSPRMTWVSKSGVDYGYAAFAQTMRKDFADPKSMGTYSAEILDARDLGPGTSQIVFRWKIMRGDERLMGGMSTQIWRKIGGNWRAVFEHAS